MPSTVQMFFSDGAGSVQNEQIIAECIERNVQACLLRDKGPVGRLLQVIIPL